MRISRSISLRTRLLPAIIPPDFTHFHQGILHHVSFLSGLRLLTAFATVPVLPRPPAAPAASTAIPTAPQVDARAYIVVDYPHRQGPGREGRGGADGAGQPHQAHDGLHRVSGAGGGQAQARRAGHGERARLALGRLAHLHRTGQAGVGAGSDLGHDRAVGQRCHDRPGRTHRRHRRDLRAADERQRQAPGDGRQPFREQLRTALAPALHHGARSVAARRPPSFASIPQYYKWLFGARVRAQRHQAAEPQRPAREGSDGRRPEDGPYRFGRLLPGDLFAARRHAADLGGHGLDAA